MSKKVIFFLLVALLVGSGLSCSPKQPDKDVKAQAADGKLDGELPIPIEKGAKIQYRTASGGWNVGSRTPVVQEVRKRWILVKGEGHTDIGDDHERWVSIDDIIWYRIVKLPYGVQGHRYLRMAEPFYAP